MMKIKKQLLITFFKKLFLLIVCGSGLWGVAYAGGGGENMLLVVNPNDEPSLRIANAYIAARHIPANNVLYLVPPSAGGGGATELTITDSQFFSGYLTPINNAIQSRGLINQIDYIGTLGQSQAVGMYALTDCLSELTQFQQGLTVAGLFNRFFNHFSELLQDPTFFYTQTFDYSFGTNTAIHHSQALPDLCGIPETLTVQFYMAGMIGYAGQYGLQTDQVIKSLQRSVAADGTKPQGTIYFEDSGDVRTIPRQPYWASVQSYMTAHGIPWIQELGSLPVNRQDVIGAEIGVSGFIAPQGSRYLPGSWADNLTSWGGIYYTDAGPNETTTSMLIQSGCAASGGTVAEPGAGQQRFTMCDIFVYSHEGSTLGEAFYKSVCIPDLNMFHGDLLSQAFADIPQVIFTSAPSEGSSVNGTISVSATASLTNPSVATGIASFTLFIDGINSGLASNGSSSATFNLNTTTLTDGLHELRVVAYNNSQAASEGYAILNVAVNNLGQAVGIAGTNSYKINWNQSLPLSVSAVQGSGPAITGIQLQSNGRVLGSIVGSSGVINLSGTQLALYGNPITPVALLSNSSQIVGPTITVNKRNHPFVGTRPIPVNNQNRGFDYYYYQGAAGNTLATTNFSGTATMVGHAHEAAINYKDAAGQVAVNLPTALSRTGLAIAINGSFTVMTPGEDSFWGLLSVDWTSVGILIDGVLVRSFDRWNGSSFVLQNASLDTGGGAYLLPGEHTVTFQLVQATPPTGNMSAILYYNTQRIGVPYSVVGGGAFLGAGNIIGDFATSPTFYTLQKTNGH